MSLICRQLRRQLFSWKSYAPENFRWFFSAEILGIDKLARSSAKLCGFDPGAFKADLRARFDSRNVLADDISLLGDNISSGNDLELFGQLISTKIRNSPNLSPAIFDLAEKFFTLCYVEKNVDLATKMFENEHFLPVISCLEHIGMIYFTLLFDMQMYQQVIDSHRLVAGTSWPSVRLLVMGSLCKLQTSEAFSEASILYFEASTTRKKMNNVILKTMLIYSYFAARLHKLDLAFESLPRFDMTAEAYNLKIFILLEMGSTREAVLMLQKTLHYLSVAQQQQPVIASEVGIKLEEAVRRSEEPGLRQLALQVEMMLVKRCRVPIRTLEDVLFEPVVFANVPRRTRTFKPVRHHMMPLYDE